jgi:hypothetical protein
MCPIQTDCSIDEGRESDTAGYLGVDWEKENPGLVGEVAYGMAICSRPQWLEIACVAEGAGMWCRCRLILMILCSFSLLG